jgi:hypothetical protein
MLTLQMPLLQRQKKVMHLSEKFKMLDRLAKGESVFAVGRHFGINESSVQEGKLKVCGCGR